MSKITINLDSTSLGASACITNYIRTTVGDPSHPELGAYKTTPNAAMIYGVAVHKYTDTMYKTGGYIPEARKQAEKAFFIPKREDPKKPWLGDPKHLLTTCFNLWSTQIEDNKGPFEVMMIPGECYWCEGKGTKESITTEKDLVGDSNTVSIVETVSCLRCAGTGKAIIPATELTFKIPFYEDEYILVNLCGTIDRVGKFHGGCFAIKDWKTTSAYDKEDYLSQYDMNRQLRVYTLACKMMAQLHPESTLGKVGATRMGAAIDGVFLKAKPNDNEYQTGRVMQFGDVEMNEFKCMLFNFCKKISFHVQTNYYPKEGIMNGTCDGKWNRCWQWNVCKSNESVANVLLNRDFKRVVYDPLHFDKANE